MTIDWITWSIWLVGFAIMVLWILVPIGEFRRLLRKKKADERLGRPSELSSHRSGDSA
jgi:hypothetical protein